MFVSVDIYYAASYNNKASTFKKLLTYALMAELADALDSGSSARKGVEVRVLLSAPTHNDSTLRMDYPLQGFFISVILVF